MAVKLRLKRMGRTNASFFRLNAIDSRTPRDGRVIEELGHYDPRNKDATKQFVVNLDRCRWWLDHGAVPSGTVSSTSSRCCTRIKPQRSIGRSDYEDHDRL